ncbi:triacylglycerol lipase 2 [Cajanus cajan]|uniref:Lipase n=1 Tax=Cajanus cajan TaxID=3821 RepID=A0A151SCL7_CAJCA|nr:triacylglycerol lipase 2 [Cajanus cajan]KYP52523.1 Triacylglycerol lipase 2 [Cajanus cajan]
MANIVVCLFSIIIFLCTTAAQGRQNFHPNNEWPTSSLVTNQDGGICQTIVETQGYTCEEHQVTTDDGYILSLQRLPASRSGKKADKPPVLLQHGLFCDAFTWLVNSPNGSLGFILADDGYDVWLANTRGTKYSRGHKSLLPSDKDYWNWSWDELSSYDLPAFVNYVYSQTGQRMHYTGHSLGTLMALTAFSQGKLMDMLRSAALLSPIAHMHQIASPIATLAADTFLTDQLYWLGLREFIPNGDAVSKFVEGLCSKINLKCSDLLSLFTGPNCCFTSSKLNAFLDHGLQSTATMNLIHLCQMIRTGSIAKYDYGDPEQNMLHYRQLFPPSYVMTAIPNEFPLFLSYGGLDTLSDVKNVLLLLSDLKDHDRNNLVVLFKDDYAHVDFFMGANVKQVIYDPMVDFFKAN